MSNSDFREETNVDSNVIVVLDQLAERVRAAHQAVQMAEANALASALAAGDALIAAQNHGVGPMGFEDWVRKNCRFGFSTAKLYTQLARGRAKIEAALRENPFLSLREARRLVAKPKNQKRVSEEEEEGPEEEEEAGTPENPVPEGPNLALTALNHATNEQVTAALRAKTLDWFLDVMPPEWRSELLRLVGGQAIQQLKSSYPDMRVKRLKRRHLELVHDTGASRTL